MSNSIITNSPNSNAPAVNWQDDGRLNLVIFPSIDNLQAFLRSIGVAEQFLNPPRKGIFGTYANLVGYIVLFSNLDSDSTTYSNGVKIGDSATLKFGPGQQILAVFNNLSWDMYDYTMITPGINYTVTTLKPAGPGKLPTATILPS